MPHIDLNYPDIESIGGGEFLECLEDAYARYGRDETIVITRSNKRANRFNEGIRRYILSAEEQIESGDRLMVVKNNYYYTERMEKSPMSFIANGDIALLKRIRRFEDFYGFHFADAVLSFGDYGDTEIECKILLDTLSSESPSLTREQSRQLFDEVEKGLYGYGKPSETFPPDTREPALQCPSGEIRLRRHVPQGSGRTVACGLRRPLSVRRRAHDARHAAVALYGRYARHGEALSGQFRRAIFLNSRRK